MHLGKQHSHHSNELTTWEMIYFNRPGEMGKWSEVDFIHKMVPRDTIIKCDGTVNLLWPRATHGFRLHETVIHFYTFNSYI